MRIAAFAIFLALCGCSGRPSKRLIAKCTIEAERHFPSTIGAHPSPIQIQHNQAEIGRGNAIDMCLLTHGYFMGSGPGCPPDITNHAPRERTPDCYIYRFTL